MDYKIPDGWSTHLDVDKDCYIHERSVAVGAVVVNGMVLVNPHFSTAAVGLTVEGLLDSQGDSLELVPTNPESDHPHPAAALQVAAHWFDALVYALRNEGALPHSPQAESVPRAP